jgi:hypothetical protein
VGGGNHKPYVMEAKERTVIMKGLRLGSTLKAQQQRHHKHTDSEHHPKKKKKHLFQFKTSLKNFHQRNQFTELFETRKKNICSNF